MVAGTANTLLTGLMLLALMQVIEADIAYTMVFVAGLAFTTILSSRFVFRSRLTMVTAPPFIVWYLFIYLVGVTVVHFATYMWHISHVYTTIVVICVTAPLNFIGGNYIFGAGGARLRRATDGWRRAVPSLAASPGADDRLGAEQTPRS
ncbi:MAG TPA: GtrA family protein [Solirubrobacteraceae bacterium]|nr:GtrA family protein [Solirubrobacteraceae bacterium]